MARHFSSNTALLMEEPQLQLHKYLMVVNDFNVLDDFQPSIQGKTQSKGLSNPVLKDAIH